MSARARVATEETSRRQRRCENSGRAREHVPSGPFDGGLGSHHRDRGPPMRGGPFFCFSVGYRTDISHRQI